MCEKYHSVFTELGKLKDKQIKFRVDENVVPIAQPVRISFHVQEKVEQGINQLEQQDVFEKVNGPPPWVLNIVVAPKPKPNEKSSQALKRHLVPTTNNIILEFN